MKHSKIFQYISALSAREQEKFRQFVFSPYTNQHQKSQELLEYLLSSLNRGKTEIAPEKAFAKLFPKEPYDEQKLHNLLSNLKKLFLRFLALDELEQKPFLEDILTLEACNRKNFSKLLISRTRQLDKKLEEYPYRDEHYHQARYAMQVVQGYHTGTFGDRAKTSEIFQEMMDHLDRSYLLQKLRHACHLTAHSILFNLQYDFGPLKLWMAHIAEEPGKYLIDNDLDAYYTILLSLQDEQDERHYLHMKSLLREQFQHLSPGAVADLYGFANNYCIRQINTGKSAYQHELFELYQQGLERGLLLINGYLSEWDYKNIATLGCSLKAFEWTEQFLEAFQDKLPPNRRENAYNYNLANLYYNKRLYDKVLSTLFRVQFTDVKYHLNTTFLLLRTYYAKGDTEALFSLIDTFRVYILRNRQITTAEKKGYTNFLGLAKKLVKTRLQGPLYSKTSLEEQLAALRKRIEETDNVINRYWLLEQC